MQKVQLFACLKVMLVKWVVLIEETHHGLFEVIHVFTDEEAEMSTRHLFIVNHSFSNLVSGPLSILWIR